MNTLTTEQYHNYIEQIPEELQGLRLFLLSVDPEYGKKVYDVLQKNILIQERGNIENYEEVEKEITLHLNRDTNTLLLKIEKLMMLVKYEKRIPSIFKGLIHRMMNGDMYTILSLLDTLKQTQGRLLDILEGGAVKNNFGQK